MRAFVKPQNRKTDETIRTYRVEKEPTGKIEVLSHPSEITRKQQSKSAQNAWANMTTSQRNARIRKMRETLARKRLAR